MVENGSGRFTSYFENGGLEQDGEYKDGMKQGEWTTYFEHEENPIKEISNYRDDLLEGNYVTYHFNRQEATTGSFEAGKRNGNWIWFTVDGNVESKVYLEAGNKIGEQVFYSDFQTILKWEVYENGKLVKTIVP